MSEPLLRSGEFSETIRGDLRMREARLHAPVHEASTEVVRTASPDAGLELGERDHRLAWADGRR